MQTATPTAFPHDRVSSWYDEVQRVAPALPSLTPCARRAVRQVLVSILDEGAESELETAQRCWLNDVMTAMRFS